MSHILPENAGLQDTRNKQIRRKTLTFLIHLILHINVAAKLSFEQRSAAAM